MLFFAHQQVVTGGNHLGLPASNGGYQFSRKATDELVIHLKRGLLDPDTVTCNGDDTLHRRGS